MLRTKLGTLRPFLNVAILKTSNERDIETHEFHVYTYHLPDLIVFMVTQPF